jgi:hypothetical protein
MKSAILAHIDCRKKKVSNAPDTSSVVQIIVTIATRTGTQD